MKHVKVEHQFNEHKKHYDYIVHLGDQIIADDKIAEMFFDLNKYEKDDKWNLLTKVFGFFALLFLYC